MRMVLDGLRQAVLDTAREMERLGLTRGTSGNVSAFDAGAGLLAITPSGMPYSSLAPADITVIDLQGHTIDGDRKPSSETPMHTAIYRAGVEVARNGAEFGTEGSTRDFSKGLACIKCEATVEPKRPGSYKSTDGGFLQKLSVGALVNATVHTHSPFATAFAVMSRPLPPITVPLAFLGEVPVVPFEMPGSEELASAVASVVAKGGRCCLLQNHGLVCVGRNLAEALEAAVYVEEGAEIAVHVLSAGGGLKPIPAEKAARMKALGAR